jgi:uncharacterized protein with von Willebrand factor type A (vWA) domain
VGYFHNVPAEYIYRDPYLTEKVSFESILAECDGNTSVLIVSDGGAARGDRRSERFSATAVVLWQIKQHSKLIAWLNPLPPKRWQGTTAQLIARLLSMYPLDPHGLNQAISEIR